MSCIWVMKFYRIFGGAPQLLGEDVVQCRAHGLQHEADFQAMVNYKAWDSILEQVQSNAQAKGQ